MPLKHASFDAASLPDRVTNDVVYISDSGRIVAKDGKLIQYQEEVLDKSAEHQFIKEVIRSNKLQIFNQLLAAKIPLHMSDVYLACQHGHLEMMRVILGSGKINVDEKTKYGWTPLEIAALNGRSDIVKELIEIYGADPNHASGRYSPLEYAIEGGHLDTVQQMVTLGAKEKERMKKDIFGKPEYKVDYLRSAARLVVNEGECINLGDEFESIERYLANLSL